MSNLCDQVDVGPYPSHVRELRASRYPLEILEAGLAENHSQWGQGGYVAVPELPSGICNRVSLRPDIIPESTAVRVLSIPGGFASAELLRELARIAENLGDGHVHWTTGGTTEIYLPRANIHAAVRALNEIGMDVGSTGDDVRSASACPGTYRCDAALINAPAIANAIGLAVIDDQQYPGLPHKVKTGVSGCPNDCMRCQMQKDHAFIGVFRGAPRVDCEKFRAWEDQTREARARGEARGIDTEYLLQRCPSGAIERCDGAVAIDAAACSHCMLCINKCPAIRPSEQRGVAWIVGAKNGHRGANGPMLGFVLAPFISAVAPDYGEIVDLYQRFLDVFVEYGHRKERIGDMLTRVGLRTVLELMEIEPEPSIMA